MNPTSVNELSAAIKGLSLQQAQLALSTKNLTREQMNQVLVQAGLIASEDKIQAELLQSTLAQAGLSAEKQKAILIEANLMNAMTGEVIATKACTKEELLHALATQGVTGANADAIVSTLGLAGANESATVSFGLFTKAVWANVKAIGAWLLTTPAGWFTLLAGAAVGTALIFKQFNTTLNEAGKTLSEQNEKFQSLSKEISSLSDELKTATDRIKELESLPSLTIVEDEELQKLKDTTEELEYQLAIKKEEQRIEAQKTAKAANDAYNASFQHMYDGSGELITSPTDENWNPVQELKNTIKAYENYKKSYDELQSKITQDSNNGKNTAKDQNRLNNLKKQMVSIEEHAKEMFGVVNDQKTAYEGLYQAGYELGDTEMSIYEDVKSGTDAYQVFCNALNDTTKAYSKLSNEEKRQSILNKAILGGKTREEAQKIVDSISDDDLEAVAQIHFDRESSIQSVHDEIDAVKSEAESYGNELEMSVFSKSDMISSINELSEGFEELDKIFSSISDKNPFDFKLLDDKNFKETFSGLESYADFVETISSNSNDIDACRDSFGELVKEWINGKGVLDNVNESTAQLTTSMLENMGIANAQEIVEAELYAQKLSLAQATKEQAIAEANSIENTRQREQAVIDANSAYSDEIATLDAEIQELGYSSDATKAYWVQKQIANGTIFEVGADISQLQAVVKALGIGANAWSTYYAAKADMERIANSGEDYIDIGHDQGKISAEKAIANRKAIMQSAMEQLSNDLSSISVNYDYAGGNKSNKAGGGGSKDAWKEAYEKELAELEHLHEMGLISDEEYYNQRIALNEKYFGEASGKHEKYLDEYRKNEEQIADGLKKLWEDYWNDYKDNLDKVSSYAEKLFQRQIDELNKKKDKSDDSYEKEIESIESVIKRLEDKRDKEEEYWQDQIDAIQKEIDSLQDANDERERSLNLAKKMYELYRAMSQRSILQYSQEKGFHYVTNDSEIKDKKEEVDQAKFDITIANLQKQKDALEDKLDEITDKYDVQIEKLNYRKETIEKNMDAENKRIQEQIDLLEEQKSKWTEVADNIEFAMLEKEMMEKYGSDVTQKILGGDVQFLNDFISQYEHATGVINSLNNATLNDIMNMAGQFGVYAENLGGVADIAKEVADKQAEASAQVTQASDSIDTSNMQSQIANAGSSADSSSVQIQGVVDKLNGLATEASNISIPALNSSEFATSVEGVIKQLEELKGKFSTISDEIKASWNNMIGGIVGTSSSGNGDPLAGGASSNSYSGLFTPLEKEIDAAKLIIDGKLKELQGLWTQFQGELAGIIGVGEGSRDSGSQSGVPSISLNAGESKGKGSDKGKESKSESSGADTIIGAIQTGGEMIDQSLNTDWIGAFQTFGSTLNEICQKIVACVNEMAEKVVEACIKAIEAINKANAAKNSSSSNNSKPPKFEGSAYVGQAFAKGSEDIAVDKDQTVLLNELGEEGIIRDGKLNKVTGGAQFHNVKKGDIILNHKQMKELETKGKITSGNKHGKLIGSFANGTNPDGTITLASGTTLTPIQPEDSGYKLVKIAEQLKSQMVDNMIPSFDVMGKNVEMITKNINSIQNRQQSMNIIENVNVNCPGITSQEVAKQIGTELQKTFSGMSLNAYQKMNVTR